MSAPEHHSRLGPSGRHAPEHYSRLGPSGRHAPDVAPSAAHPGLAPQAGRSGPRRWLDAILLRRAAATVKGRSAEQQRRVRAYWSAAERRSAAARALCDADHAAPAISLHREAAVCLIAAIVLGRDPDAAPPHAIPEAWARLDELLRAGALTDRPADFEAARAALSDPDPLAADALPEATASARRRVVESTMRWLAAQIEPRHLAEIRAAVALRLGIALAVVAALAVSAVLLARAPRNVALGKPVVASSRAQGSPPPEEVVDGKTVGSCGLRTERDPSPSVTIDLGASHAIAGVRVYNRGDGQIKVDESFPMVVELSQNGTDYVVLGRRQEPFGHLNPWTQETSGQRARYVRVRVDHVGVLCLNEIEVYAR